MNNYGQQNGGYNPNQYSRPDYDPTQYGGYDSSYGANGSYDYDMGPGYEQGNNAGPGVYGLNNLKAIISTDVVAKSYLFMVVALIITAGSSLTTSPMTAITMMDGYNFLFVFFAEVALVWIATFFIRKNVPIVAAVCFAAYAYLTGMICSVLFLLYTGGSLVSTFLICSAMFAITAIYGMVTKRDLTSLGSICFMALIGLILASTVNIFILHSNVFDLAVSAIGIIIFVGLTAYDANKTKRIAEESDTSNSLSLSLYCAIELYLDFINIFLKLIRLFGKRK